MILMAESFTTCLRREWRCCVSHTAPLTHLDVGQLARNPKQVILPLLIHSLCEHGRVCAISTLFDVPALCDVLVILLLQRGGRDSRLCGSRGSDLNVFLLRRLVFLIRGRIVFPVELDVSVDVLQHSHSRK